MAGPVTALYQSSETPLPAALASASLLGYWPFTGSQFTRRGAPIAIKPNRASVLGFGAAFALGGFIIYDGDVTNGAGFTSAWSILYLMVNGKASIKQMRPWPMLVGGLVTFNAVNYGRKFFFPSQTRPKNPLQ